LSRVQRQEGKVVGLAIFFLSTFVQQGINTMDVVVEEMMSYHDEETLLTAAESWKMTPLNPADENLALLLSMLDKRDKVASSPFSLQPRKQRQQQQSRPKRAVPSCWDEDKMERGGSNVRKEDNFFFSTESKKCRSIVEIGDFTFIRSRRQKPREDRLCLPSKVQKLIPHQPKELRIPNSCSIHKRNHQKCPRDCEHRKAEQSGANMDVVMNENTSNSSSNNDNNNSSDNSSHGNNCNSGTNYDDNVDESLNHKRSGKRTHSESEENEEDFDQCDEEEEEEEDWLAN